MTGCRAECARGEGGDGGEREGGHAIKARTRCTGAWEAKEGRKPFSL